MVSEEMLRICRSGIHEGLMFFNGGNFQECARVYFDCAQRCLASVVIPVDCKAMLHDATQRATAAFQESGRAEQSCLILRSALDYIVNALIPVATVQNPFAQAPSTVGGYPHRAGGCGNMPNNLGHIGYSHPAQCHFTQASVLPSYNCGGTAQANVMHNYNCGGVTQANVLPNYSRGGAGDTRTNHSYITCKELAVAKPMRQSANYPASLPAGAYRDSYDHGASRRQYITKKQSERDTYGCEQAQWRRSGGTSNRSWDPLLAGAGGMAAGAMLMDASSTGELMAEGFGGLAGASLGSNYGVGGTVAGGLLGMLVGDVLFD